MFNRFTKSTRLVVVQALEEARRRGARRAEAEHLLLALTRNARVGPVLRDAGLDHDAAVAALEAEATQALAVVGVSASDYGLPAPAPVEGNIGMGTSGKLALERTLKIAVERGDKKLEPAHVGLALLVAEAGTVPRALAAAGVDTFALADGLRATL
jgi:ATP-dependent Clp protease ATP-binding subunit ClpA